MWQVLGTLLGSAGPWALALAVMGLVVVALVLGWLIPRATHDRIVRGLERQINATERERDLLREQVAIFTERVWAGHGS